MIDRIVALVLISRGLSFSGNRSRTHGLDCNSFCFLYFQLTLYAIKCFVEERIPGSSSISVYNRVDCEFCLFYLVLLQANGIDA